MEAGALVTSMGMWNEVCVSQEWDRDTWETPKRRNGPDLGPGRGRGKGGSDLENTGLFIPMTK